MILLLLGSTIAYNALVVFVVSLKLFNMRVSIIQF